MKNFDFSWFLTTPGILTGLGCLLILISIIIFISSLMGDKKKKSDNVSVTDTPVDNTSDNVTTNAVTTESVAETPAPVTPEVTPEAPAPVVPEVAVNVEPVAVTPVAPEAAAPVVPEVAVNVEPVAVTPVAPEAPAPVVPEVAVNVEPVAVTPEVAPEAAAPVVPEVAVNIEPVAVTPEVTPAVPTTATSEASTASQQNPSPNPIEITFESINQAPVTSETTIPQQGSLGNNPQPTVTPTQELPKKEEVKPTIYGGADPLAGTGIIQTVQTTTNVNKDDIESL